eukprot:11769791-Heterocapsa_arctica.AAC.1
MVEKARPAKRSTVLYGGNEDWEDSYRLTSLRGWDDEEDPAEPSINQSTVYRKYMEDQNALWLESGSMAWDGLESPC